MSRLSLQELGASVEGWTDDLASLFQLRESLEGVVSPDDITILQERLRLLQRQWEEVCHQVPPPTPNPPKPPSSSTCRVSLWSGKKGSSTIEMTNRVVAES